MPEREYVKHTRPVARFFWEKICTCMDKDILRLELERFEKHHGDEVRRTASPEEVINALVDHLGQVDNLQGFADIRNWNIDLWAHLLALYAHRTRISARGVDVGKLIRNVEKAVDKVNAKLLGGPESIRLASLPTVLKHYKSLMGVTNRKR